MRLEGILDTLLALDGAYATIADEHDDANAGGRAPSWTSLVRERPRRPAGVATGDLHCAKHSGAPHGLPYDALSDHLASEMAGWVLLSRWSGTARKLLGIDRLDPAPGTRLGAAVYLDEERSFRVRFAATGDTLVAVPGEQPLWAEGLVEATSIRPRHELGESYLFYSYTGGKARRWSFSDVQKGYEEYLASQGRRPDDPAVAMLSTCPTPKLLGALDEYNRRSSTGRVPLALSEAWLFGAVDELPGELQPPCEACRFGLSAWMDGYDSMLARAAAAGDTGYAEASEAWVKRIRERREPERKVTVAVAAATPATEEEPGVILDKTGSETGVILDKTGSKEGVILDKTGSQEGVILDKTGSKEGVILDKTGSQEGVILDKTGSQEGVILDKTAALAGGMAMKAAPPPAPAGEPSFAELPERDVTGGDRYRRNRPAPLDPAALGPAAGARKERAQVRLESADFPCDDVSIRELWGKEAIGELFSFHVDVVCFDDSGLDPAKVLGAGVALVFERGSIEVRRVHGMVAEVHDRLETESEWRSYRLWIVPRVWRSTLVETQEVYLDTSVPDLIAQKLELVGLTGDDVQMRLLGSYPQRELIVQYKETDVAFLSRLVEHLGVSFFFEHGSADQIVFCDDNSGFRPLPGAETLYFRPRGEKVDVFELEARSRAFPASFAMQDYNYRTPTVDLTSVHEAPEGFGGGVVEYGAHYKTPAEGEALAKVRAQEREVANRYYVGESDVAEMTAGGKFHLSGHPRLDGMEFLVVEVDHHAKQTVKMSGSAGDDDAYRTSFRAVDAKLPYRPPRSTPRPRIHGVLTALVEPNPTGEIGESARIDTEGRYTVRFYFDAGDVAGREKHSRPVRMIQPHAGPGYGIHFPLKPGIEVLLVFMDGDPDRPMILGAVPNPITPSPVAQEVNLMNRIETASGLLIEMRDAVPPLSK